MKIQRKSIRNWAIGIFTFIVVSMVSSYGIVGIINPIKSSASLIKLYFLNSKYVELQQYPQIIISKPTDSKKLLIEYMENNGFSLEDENVENSIMLFTHPDVHNYIQLKENFLVAQWIWRE